jgi:hypothetical protein
MPPRTWKSPASSSLSPGYPEAQCPAEDTITDSRIVTVGPGRWGQARSGRVPVVRASVYAPCAGRTRWWFAYICAHCGCGHLGRALSEEGVQGHAANLRRDLGLTPMAKAKLGRTLQPVVDVAAIMARMASEEDEGDDGAA